MILAVGNLAKFGLMGWPKIPRSGSHLEVIEEQDIRLGTNFLEV